MSPSSGSLSYETDGRKRSVRPAESNGHSRVDGLPLSPLGISIYDVLSSCLQRTSVVAVSRLRSSIVDVYAHELGKHGQSSRGTLVA